MSIGTAAVGAEVLKIRSTRDLTRLVAAMSGLVVTAVALHGMALDAGRLSGAEAQVSMLIGWGALVGSLSSGLAGVMSYTVELRHRTIAPTLLATPRRRDLVMVKAAVSALAGALIGASATITAAITGAVVLTGRGITTAVGAAELGQFIAGGTIAGALWALLGLGIGVVVRDQLAAGAGLVAWTLLVEGILVDTVPTVGRAAPGALARALAGINPNTLTTPVFAAIGLIVYATASLSAALVCIGRDHA